MDGQKEHNVREAWGRYIKWAILAFAVLLAVLLFFLVRDYRSLRRAKIINARESLLSAMVKSHGHLTLNDVSVIRSWMTFDYINQLFGIPPAYFKDQMSIADARYPKLSLSGYAKSQHLASAAIVGDVENAIRDYFATSTPVASSTHNM
jgi:hypothetical protein